jgi:NitT/TauT family transport system substrate-binding protein
MKRSAFLAGIPAFAAAAASAQTATLRVGATANDTYGEAYYALDMGFFANAGLAIDLQTFPNGGAIASAIASGALDVGVGNPVQLANGIAHGIPFVYFAAGGLYDTAAPTTVMCVAKDSPIRDPKDLEGKAVANPTIKDLTYAATVAYLQAHGADVSKVQMTELTFSEMGPALRRGTVAAAIISEPSLTAALSSDVRIFAKVFDAIAPRFLIAGWYTTREWYAKNSALAGRFAGVTYQTARWANRPANRAKSGEILAKYSKIAPDVAKRMTRCTFAESLSPGLLDPTLRLAAKAKITDRLVTAAEMIVRA